MSETQTSRDTGLARPLYGSVHRHFALRAVNTQLPGMSPVLAAEWAKGRTSAWVQGEAGWEQLAVDRGAWQGAPPLTAATSASKLAWEQGIAGGDDLKAKLKEAGLDLQNKKSTADHSGDAACEHHQTLSSTQLS